MSKQLLQPTPHRPLSFLPQPSAFRRVVSLTGRSVAPSLPPERLPSISQVLFMAGLASTPFSAPDYPSFAPVPPLLPPPPTIAPSQGTLGMDPDNLAPIEPAQLPLFSKPVDELGIERLHHSLSLAISSSILYRVKNALESALASGPNVLQELLTIKGGKLKLTPLEHAQKRVSDHKRLGHDSGFITRAQEVVSIIEEYAAKIDHKKAPSSPKLDALAELATTLANTSSTAAPTPSATTKTKQGVKRRADDSPPKEREEPGDGQEPPRSLIIKLKRRPVSAAPSEQSKPAPSPADPEKTKKPKRPRGEGTTARNDKLWTDEYLRRGNGTSGRRACRQDEKQQQGSDGAIEESKSKRRRKGEGYTAQYDRSVFKAATQGVEAGLTRLQQRHLKHLLSEKQDGAEQHR